MPAQIYYDQDADLGLLKGKKIAIIGYGSQGHAQAQNLKDSGCDVIVGQRPGSPNYDLAVSHGFKPVSAAEAAKAGDLVNMSCSVPTASTYTSARSFRPRASTSPWWPPRAPATSCVPNTSRAAACRV